MEYFCGIDIGASAAKLVLIDDTGEIVSNSVRRSGVDYSATADELLDEALSGANIEREQIAGSLSTGYGRDNVPWVDAKMTEIACHGKGAHYCFPERITVIDIGAQDSKIVHLAEDGHRLSFKMNRKCAAGTGAFLEEIAHRLSISIDDMNSLAERSTKETPLGSFCTVFAATEVLSKIRAGEKVEDIVKGAFSSVVKRIVEMDRIDGTLVMTGGVVAHNPLLVRMIGESFGTQASVVPDAQFAGALGAALYAREKTKKGQTQC
ncbi:acyl-CoA dehydratase activase [Candidatus Hydrogenedentota bacterium]